MDKIRKILFVCFCVGTLSVVMFCTILRKDINMTLKGVVNEAAFPELKYESVWNGEYQTQVDTWYKDNFPFRPLMVRLNNQALYALSADINNDINVGKDGWLYTNEYINSGLKEVTESNKVLIEEYAEKVKLVKEKVEKSGKQFIYVITPSKVEIYPENMPFRYTLLMKERDSIQNNYDYLKQQLTLQGISFIDTAEILKEHKDELQLFSKTGIHWNYYAAALGAEAVINEVDEDIDTEVVVTEYTGVRGMEQDIYLLTNIFKGQEDNVYYSGEINCSNIDTLREKKVFEMGTSFSGELEKGFFPKDSGIWNQYIRYQYFTGKNVSKGTLGAFQTGDFYNEQLKAELASADIIILENNNSYVPDSHIQFVDYILNMTDEELTKPDVLNLDNNEVVIDFSIQGNGDEFTWSGFYGAEEAGRWAMPCAEICVEMQATERVVLEFAECTFAPNTKILFNDNIIWQEQQGVEKLAGIAVPCELIRNGQVNYITIITDEDIKSPQERGISEDSRVIAHWINKVVLRTDDKEGT